MPILPSLYLCDIICNRVRDHGLDQATAADFKAACLFWHEKHGEDLTIVPKVGIWLVDAMSDQPSAHYRRRIKTIFKRWARGGKEEPTLEDRKKLASIAKEAREDFNAGTEAWTNLEVITVALASEEIEPALRDYLKANKEKVVPAMEALLDFFKSSKPQAQA